jgi:hypothetical protein
MQFELCLSVYRTAVNELYYVSDSIDAGFCHRVVVIFTSHCTYVMVATSWCGFWLSPVGKIYNIRLWHPMPAF